LGPDPDPILIQSFDDPENWEKFFAEKNLKIFSSKIAIYLSFGLDKGGPSYRRSLRPSKSI
jgi:hypothetical protein